MRLRLSNRNLVLAVVAFIVVIYAEWIGPSQAMANCSWPMGPGATHVALIADPQLVDDNTYPTRNGILMYFTQVYADRYMARNFRLIHSRLKPDAIFFLGDLFDGGREWGELAWRREEERWKHVFPLHKKIPHYQHVVGNHDVGSTSSIRPEAYERFMQTFGNPNQVVQVGSYSFVSVDTSALMDQRHPSIHDAASTFLDHAIAQRDELNPIVFLTHVPLYRPDRSYCGLEREGKPFAWETGNQYITEVNPDITAKIINELRPVIVYSGDDHDHCRYPHKVGTTYIDEYTVKSFSLAMGIRRPGFQMLSLNGWKHQDTDQCLVGPPFEPLITQLVVFGLILAGLGLLLRYELKPTTTSKYEALPVTEKTGQTMSNLRLARVYRENIYGVVLLAVGWVVGQIVVHNWSYSNL